ncbi:McrB family protein [Psychrobacter sp. Pi2-51]|uniref:McrB family protein n=1 Tax=Psychrobacter sp. Pi2-51 TaxID=2774132 RepID=UPI0019184F42|nr:AAA family ATPase [Psychrobacter sp. Pi2-51]
MPEREIHEPTNIIYTGVAGTGKTYQLLQVAQRYTDDLPRANAADLLAQLLQTLSWRDVVCLVFLDFHSEKQDLIKVPEIVNHEFFVAKAAQNAREKNLSNTAWSVLQMHSPTSSKTVTYKNRASQAYFDKDNSGAWYLLPESMLLLKDLSQKLAEFQQAQHDNTASQHHAFSDQRFSMVSFHQAYGYEEFVEGIRPVMSASGHTNPHQTGNNQAQMSYAIQDGAFLKLCQRAARDPKRRYAILIDEINRANVSRVFGELLSLIEADKRAGTANAMSVNLAYSGRAFSVPANVDIYATMNTQDHSLAPLDMALRRRFRFIHCPPKPELLSIITAFGNANQSLESTQSAASIDLTKLLTGLNNRINQTLGIEAQLGHAFLFGVQSLAQLQTALIEQIIPQVAQAAGGQVAILQYVFRDEQQPMRAQFIQNSQAAISRHLDDEINDQTNTMTPSQLFSGHNAFLGQSMHTGSYKINEDFLARTGEFTNSSVYQRLY